MRSMFVAIALLVTAPVSAGADCPEDLDGSGEVGFSDLIDILSSWGPCPKCAQDLDGDDAVGFSDLLQMLAAWGPCPFTAVELAGNPLLAYPHFEFVRAFNEGEPIHLAVDPHRFPGIVGESALAYIVAAKTAGQWDADPALVDVRGDPQPVTFSGPDIQDVVIALTGSEVLSADAGPRLGVGYDLVINFDSDGQLSSGDLIDGYAEEAGFYVVHDLTQPGPLKVTHVDYEVEGVTAGFESQRTWYPIDIESMGMLPLVTVGLGGGAQYTWYDYIGKHLASYGLLVMSYENNTNPGIESASTTTLLHTEAIIGQQAEVGGGILDGHIDPDRIVWIGHGRGGEGVVRAYDRIRDGTYVAKHFEQAALRLISSIAPTDFLGLKSSNPGDVPYHLIWGAADGDVDGSPGCRICQSFHLRERGGGFRHVTYVHGMDHGDLNCCDFDDFDGPPGTAIGRPEAQRIAKAMWLVLTKRYLEGNVPATDYLWRQWERFRPIGVAPDTTVDLEYGEPIDVDRFVIDDFQTQPSPEVSSSGGSVILTVANVTEGLLDDNNTSFTWLASDPMNGMTRAREDDDTSGLVFDYDQPSILEFEIIAEERDFSDDVSLSFRACQGTRHPLTAAALEDLTFTVTLRDGDGTESSISIGAYGGGIEEPYQRTASGTGAGWQNEFETIRIRPTDFTHNRPDLDLTNIEAVRFDFGAPFGSPVGRLGLDDIELSKDLMPSE